MTSSIYTRAFCAGTVFPWSSRSYISNDKKLIAVAQGARQWDDNEDSSVEKFFWHLDHLYNSQESSTISCDFVQNLKDAAYKCAAKDIDYFDNLVISVIALALIENGIGNLLHAGDCRAYLLRDSELSQLSTDQTMVTEMIKAGRLSQEAARTNPYRHLVTNVLGQKIPESIPLLYNYKMVIDCCSVRQN